MRCRVLTKYLKLLNNYRQLFRVVCVTCYTHGSIWDIGIWQKAVTHVNLGTV